MGLFDQVKSFFVRKKKYRPETLTELKQLVNNPAVSLKDIDISQITSFEGLFENSQRTDFSGIENWDVSHVTNMRRCFYNCQHFNADISRWNVENVKAVSMMFAYAKDFNQDLSSWDFKALKGHFKGRLVQNMFRGANTMMHRCVDIFSKYQEQGLALPEIYKKMPLPVPKDVEKIVIIPKTDRDVGLLFETIDDFSKLDTSAVTRLDHVLENSPRKDFTGFETLDFNNVKTAKNFLANSNIDRSFSFNDKWHTPEMESLVYADGMLKNTSYNSLLPATPKIRVIDDFLANDLIFCKPIDPIIKDSKLVSVNNAFNAVNNLVIEDPDILKNEQSRINLELIETNRITNKLKKLSTLGKTVIEVSNEVHEFLKNDHDYVVVMMDPKTRDEIIAKSNDPKIKNAFVANDNLNENNQKYKNNYNANTYVVERKVYDQITSLGKVHNPYLKTETPVKDAICKFELVDFAAKFNLSNEHVRLSYKSESIEDGNNEELLNLENALPTLKFMETAKLPDAMYGIHYTGEWYRKTSEAYAVQKNYLLEKLNQLSDNNFGGIALLYVKQLGEEGYAFNQISSSNLIPDEKAQKIFEDLSTRKGIKILNEDASEFRFTKSDKKIDFNKNAEMYQSVYDVVKTLKELNYVERMLDCYNSGGPNHPLPLKPTYNGTIENSDIKKYVDPLLSGKKHEVNLSDEKVNSVQPEQNQVKTIINKTEKKSRSR
ncbi:MAG: BspA family leucine-rich repeat surface protein [Succinivibrio dextrinosolvens]|nr:BspA family leucine-rich repeat surface protein [Succinivibrio dextrinosolvens]